MNASEKKTVMLLTSMSCCWLGQSSQHDVANSPLQTMYNELSVEAAASLDHCDSTAFIVVFVLPVMTLHMQLSTDEMPIYVHCITILCTSNKKQAGHFQNQSTWFGSPNELHTPSCNK